MALSKHQNLYEKINKVELGTVQTTIHEEEIMMQCFYTQDKAISVDLIHHLMGSPDMDYKIIPVEESIECYKYCRQKLLEFVKESKMDILFFEDHSNASSNVLIVALKQEKAKGVREHIVLLAVIRITILLNPKVAFCRYFNLRGNENYT